MNINRREFLKLAGAGIAAEVPKYGPLALFAMFLNACQDKEVEQTPEQIAQISWEKPGFGALAASLSLVEFDNNGVITRLSAMGRQFINETMVESGLHITKKPLVATAIDTLSGATVPLDGYFTLDIQSKNLGRIYTDSEGKSYLKLFGSSSSEGSRIAAKKDYDIFRALLLKQDSSLAPMLDDFVQLIEIEKEGQKTFGLLYYPKKNIETIPFELLRTILLKGEQNKLGIQITARQATQAMLISLTEAQHTFVPGQNGYPLIDDVNFDNLIAMRAPNGKLLFMPIDYESWSIANLTPEQLPAASQLYRMNLQRNELLRALPSEMSRELQAMRWAELLDDFRSTVLPASQLSVYLDKAVQLQGQVAGNVYQEQLLVYRSVIGQSSGMLPNPELFMPLRVEVSGKSLTIHLTYPWPGDRTRLYADEMIASLQQNAQIPQTLTDFDSIEVVDSNGTRVAMMIEGAGDIAEYKGITSRVYTLVSKVRSIGGTIMWALQPAWILFSLSDIRVTLRSIVLPEFWKEFSIPQVKGGENTPEVELNALFNALYAHKQASIVDANYSSYPDLKDTIVYDLLTLATIAAAIPNYDGDQYLKSAREQLIERDLIVGSLPLEFVRAGVTYTSNARIVSSLLKTQTDYGTTHVAPKMSIIVVDRTHNVPPVIVAEFVGNNDGRTWRLETKQGGSVSVIPTVGDVAFQDQDQLDKAGEYAVKMTEDGSCLYFQHYLTYEY